MARELLVYNYADLVDVPPDAWRVRDDAEPVYAKAFGSESAIRESWSEPAHLLRLSLIAAVYELGFYQGIQWYGDQLPAVIAEMERLEAYWTTADLTDDIITDLRERVGFLREAAALARGIGGWLVIM